MEMLSFFFGEAQIGLADLSQGPVWQTAHRLASVLVLFQMRLMRFGAENLRDKALLALEDAVQECRYRTPRRSHLLRFALAYLWSLSGGDRGPFDSFWEAMGEPKSPWSFTSANHALTQVYRALGLERPEAISWEMWRRWQEAEGRGGVH